VTAEDSDGSYEKGQSHNTEKLEPRAAKTGGLKPERLG
jgi:hypothetical protein